MIYGYARVSTVGQAKDGNSLEAQEQVLREKGAQVVYVDNYTGTTTDRPEFTKLVEVLQSGDILIVTKVDRLTRCLIEGMKIIDELLKRNVTVNILNLGCIDNTPAGRLTLQMFMAFAEFERNMIVERTQEGKRIAKRNPDFKDGRPAREIDELEKTYYDVKYKRLTLADALKKLNIPRSTWFYRIKQFR